MRSEPVAWSPERVGVVLSGAGARGAYEACSLSVILPALSAHGTPVRVFTGTSAGALNAVAAASLFSDAGGAASCDEKTLQPLLDLWCNLEWHSVTRSVPTTIARAMLSYAAQLGRLPRAHWNGLLSTRPLAKTVSAWPHWDALHARISTGDLRAVAAVATAFQDGTSTVFTELAPDEEVPNADPVHGLYYVSVTGGLDARHVLASAAIPVAFPARSVDSSEGHAAWYCDGMVRLNTPIKPALDLRADALVIIGTHPLKREGHPSGRPDVYDGAELLLTAAFADRMREDLCNLERINGLVRLWERLGNGLPLAWPGRESEANYRFIPWMYFGPSRADAIARCARESLKSQAGINPKLLSWLMGGRGRTHADLISWLMFDPAFMRGLVELGQRDARALLQRGLAWGGGSQAVTRARVG